MGESTCHVNPPVHTNNNLSHHSVQFINMKVAEALKPKDGRSANTMQISKLRY